MLPDVGNKEDVTMTKYLSCAETAKLVRQALKESFPGVKFSVKSKNYAGGGSINVKWMDGPLSSQVKAITDAFEGAYFDGMIDWQGSSYATLDGERVRFGADFIFEDRDYSDELLARGIAAVSNGYGGNKPITGAEWRNGAGHYWYNDGGCDLGRALTLWLSGKAELDSIVPDRGIEAKPSATMARVKFAGDDGYGAGTVGRDPKNPNGEQAYKAVGSW
jgi:hypothetical protein